MHPQQEPLSILPAAPSPTSNNKENTLVRRARRVFSIPDRLKRFGSRPSTDKASQQQDPLEKRRVAWGGTSASELQDVAEVTTNAYPGCDVPDSESDSDWHIENLFQTPGENWSAVLHPAHWMEGRVLPISLPGCSSPRDFVAKTFADFDANVQRETVRCSIARGQFQIAGHEATWPLLHAEVACISRGGKAYSVLSMVLSMSFASASSSSATWPQGWVLMLRSEIAEEVMARLSAAGCVRDDLLDLYKLDVCRHLGRGSFSRVMRALDRAGRNVAVKIMTSSTDASTVEREVDLLIAAQGHGCVINFHGVFRHTEVHTVVPFWSLVFECHILGDLDAWVELHGPLEEAMAKLKLRDCLEALAHLETRGIVHRDVKPGNLLLCTSGRVVLADFGLAARAYEVSELTQQKGSWGYAAPEIFLGKLQTHKVDAFGAGGVLYFFLTGQPPFVGDSDQAVITKTLEGCPKALPSNSRSSRDCPNLVWALTQFEPGQRKSAAQALISPWMNVENSRPFSASWALAGFRKRSAKPAPTS